MYQNNLNLYKNLYLIRRTQEQISKNYHPEDKMRCPIHLCFGQEFRPSVLGLFLKNPFFLFHDKYMKSKIFNKIPKQYQRSI